MPRPPFPDDVDDDDAEMSSPPPEGIPALEAEVASAAKRMRAATVRASEAVETASESDARARAALEAEAAAARAARAVTAACESVAQRLANDLGHRHSIARLRTFQSSDHNTNTKRSLIF